MANYGLWDRYNLVKFVEVLLLALLHKHLSLAEPLVTSTSAINKTKQTIILPENHLSVSVIFVSPV